MSARIIILLFLLSNLTSLHLFIQSISAYPIKTPKLHTFYKHPFTASEKFPIQSTNLKTYFYNQTLDHFNYSPSSYETFRQKYLADTTYWGGANSSAPIFAFLGAEIPLNETLDSVGFLKENAPFFKSLIVYIEHRFYGDSVPFGSFKNAMKNDTLRGYFNSAQALADYAEVLLYIKEQFSSPNSPVIVVGVSYGGLLASWFRLKYPHITLGALASSAPILNFDNNKPEVAYYSALSKDFKDVSESCYQTIRNSWNVIDRVASQPDGLSILSRTFNTCSPLTDSLDLTDFLMSMYMYAAQYDEPYHHVEKICKAIDGAPKGTDVLGKIFAGAVSYHGNKKCLMNFSSPSETETSMGWDWQRCSEIVMPSGGGGVAENDELLFPLLPFNLTDYINDCQQRYNNVKPRPHWITTYYGGHDIKLVLQRFGSNIIFSNGMKDPYSSGGVLENLSESLLAVTTINGSHGLDILTAAKTDPGWLIEQRKVEVKIIDGWIQQYYADLKVLKK